MFLQSGSFGTTDLDSSDDKHMRSVQCTYALFAIRSAVWIGCCDVPTHMGEKIIGADQSSRKQPVQVIYRAAALEVTRPLIRQCGYPGIAIAYIIDAILLNRPVMR
jgi:hypothetical protein